MPYQEWKDAALALDEYMHFDEWKLVDEDMYYDWKLVRKVRCMPSSHAAEGLLDFPKVRRSLKTFREKNDARGLLGVLETCIRTNFAGVESAR